MSEINRRSFLTRLFAVSAGLVVGAEIDVERLLWTPKPIITVPAMPTGLPLGNQFVTREWFDLEVLKRLERNLVFAGRVNRSYDAPLVGDTITVRLSRYDARG